MSPPLARSSTTANSDGRAQAHLSDERGGDSQASGGRPRHRRRPHHRHPRPVAHPDLRRGRRAADGFPRRLPAAHRARRAEDRPGPLREDVDRHDDERAHGALHRAARPRLRCARDRRQGRHAGRGNRADAPPRDGLLRARGRRGGARDHADRGDRGGRLGGADARVPLALPPRPAKPRQIGLTHVLDKGLNLREIEGMFDTAGDYVDVVKLGWGTSYVTRNLEKKIALYRSFETPVVCGGTLFEAVVARGKLDEYKRWLINQRFSHVEISDGTVEIPRERKLDLIAEFARDFTVLSEVGSKDVDVNYAPYLWVQWIKEELEAGAWKVITEARESGTAGIFRPTGEIRSGLIDEIAHEIDVHDVVFEAPTKAAQAWFVRQFGPDVNLGNIPPEEVIPLETLRLGLRADTINEVLLAEHPGQEGLHAEQRTPAS